MNLSQSVLSETELAQISKTIAFIESSTSGEVKVSICKKPGFFSRNKSIKDLAVKEFYRLGLDKTRQGTGLLIYILLQRHEFYILSDKGLNDKLSVSFWEGEVQKMSRFFKDEKFADGIIAVLNDVGKILKEQFPSDKNDNPDEISNDVEIR